MFLISTQGLMGQGVSQDVSTSFGQNCTLCRRPACCPRCRPSGYGLKVEDTRAKICEDCGIWCLQCNLHCFSPNAGLGASHAPRKVKPSFRVTPRSANSSIGQPKEASGDAQAQNQPETHAGKDQEAKTNSRSPFLMKPRLTSPIS